MLVAPPSRPEIDHRTLKLLVGGIALGLAPLVAAFAPEPLGSISAAYWAGGWSQSLLTGCLFAIAAFLAAYNGESRGEMLLSKAAAAAALGVALWPCNCGRPGAPPGFIHYASAAVMFAALAGFCAIFWKRARRKAWTEALRRARIYAACGGVIVLSMAALAVEAALGDRFLGRWTQTVFFFEALALAAFGISWLTASRTLPVITRRDERFSPMQAGDPAGGSR